MPTTWVETTKTETSVDRAIDHDAIVALLHATGALDLAKQLMDEDARGVLRPSVSFDEARAILKAACCA